MKKISVCIPYKQRIENIEIVFDELSNQTMDTAEFEVIVGAMEYSEECKKFSYEKCNWRGHCSNGR